MMRPTILSGTMITSEAAMEANISLPLTDIIPRDAGGSLREGFFVSGPGGEQDRCHLFHGLTFEFEINL
jgi:hypothetical protein